MIPSSPRSTLALSLVALAALAAPPAGAVVKTYSSSPGIFVPDALPPGPGTPQSVTDTIFVPDSGTINDINVTVTVQHPQYTDVTVSLTDPSGLVTVQMKDTGGGPGDGLYDVTFDDEATDTFPDFTVNGTCQVGVSFQSEPDLLSDFDGLEVNGLWTITVTDNFYSDASDCDCDGFVVGPDCPRTFDEWSMEIDFTAAVATTADLAITKSDGLAEVDQGDQLTYTIEVSNAGPDDVTGASVDDSFPAALDCTWTCAASAGSSCTAGPVAGDISDSVDLLAGGSATYSAVCDVAPDASGTLSNTATVTAPGDATDPDPSNDSATDETDVNQTPVAVCTDVEATADEVTCTAVADVDDGSFDPDGDPITLEQDPPGPYGLGDTVVTLTVSDGSLSDTCQGTVTVVDDAAPVISCNTPPTIVPPDAPISFTATADDACGPATAVVDFYDCYKFTKKEKRIDKTGSCVVSIAGDTVTIDDSGGVGTTIEWQVTATDGSGNQISMTCSVEVANPGNG